MNFESYERNTFGILGLKLLSICNILFQSSSENLETRGSKDVLTDNICSKFKLNNNTFRDNYPIVILNKINIYFSENKIF